MNAPLPPEPLNFASYRTAFYREQVHRAYQDFKHKYRRVEECVRVQEAPPAQEHTLFHLLSIWASTSHAIELLRPRLRFEMSFQYTNLSETMFSLVRNFAYLDQGHLAQVWGKVNDDLAVLIFALEKEPETHDAPYHRLQRYYTYVRWFQKGLAAYRVRERNCNWSELFLDSLTHAHFQELCRLHASRLLYDSSYPEEFWWFRLS